jgi:polar amino acid transport system substrate-binding protein
MRWVMIACALAFLGCGCAVKKEKERHCIAVDPNFFPLELKHQTRNLFAFTHELLQAMSKESGVTFEQTQANWDNLLDGLRLNTYEGAITSMTPNLINTDRYIFSESYFPIGPVLVLPIHSKETKLESLGGHVIGIEKNDTNVQLMTLYPDVLFSFYTSIASAFEEVANGKLHGALIPIIPATAYVRDLYSQALQIASEPLTDEGLRLVTCRGQNPRIISIFNSALDRVKKDGTYNSLVEKWLFPN